MQLKEFGMLSYCCDGQYVSSPVFCQMLMEFLLSERGPVLSLWYRNPASLPPASKRNNNNKKAFHCILGLLLNRHRKQTERRVTYNHLRRKPLWRILQTRFIRLSMYKNKPVTNTTTLWMHSSSFPIIKLKGNVFCWLNLLNIWMHFQYHITSWSMGCGYKQYKQSLNSHLLHNLWQWACHSCQWLLLQ